MNKINQSVIETLAAEQKGAVLSIYLPTHHISTPATVKEDQTRLKNLIRQGFGEWQEKVGEEEIKGIREQLDSMVDDESFWTDMTQGIALFVNIDTISIYHLPIECQEYIYVGNEFDITPLRICVEVGQPHYVFALAKHDPKLFYGDSYGLEPVAIDFPSSPEDALNIDEMFSDSNTVRGVSTQGGGNDKLSSHGQGDSNHAGQEERLKYFRILDNMIMKAKSIDATLPIVIAATDSEASDFKNLSNLPNLIQEFVAGNHTTTPLRELHQLTWKIIKNEVIDKKRHLLLEQFNELKGVQKASSDPDEIMAATRTGRVDTLLVGIVPTTNDSISDTNDTNAPLIRLDDTYKNLSIRQLINSVVAQGGTIIGIDPDELATPSLVGAIYRY
jgi:release factor family 3